MPTTSADTCHGSSKTQMRNPLVNNKNGGKSPPPFFFLRKKTLCGFACYLWDDFCFYSGYHLRREGAEQTDSDLEFKN